MTDQEDYSESLLYGGVLYHIEGNGGPDCVTFLSPVRLLCETIVFVTLSIVLLVNTIKKIKVTLPKFEKKTYSTELSFSRAIHLAVFALVFGVEIGYKLSSRQVIYLLNPCHIISILQLYLLASPTSTLSTTIFRLHLYWLVGPLLAVLFPVTNSLLLPQEVTVYWIQHTLILTSPLFLLIRGDYKLEPTNDWAWPGLAFSLYSLYHWLVVQPMGILTWANLNSMLCPAICDPFAGPNYRIVATAHQAILVPLFGKLYSNMAEFVMDNFIKSSGVKNRTINNNLNEEKND